MNEDKQKKRKRINIGIIGTSGSGKEFSTKILMKKLKEKKRVYEEIIVGCGHLNKCAHIRIFSEEQCKILSRYSLEKNTSQSDRTRN